MKDRKIQLEARPAFQFIKLVDEFLESVSALLATNSKISTLKPIQIALDSLLHTVQDSTGKLGVKPALLKYEAEREIGTSDTLDKEYDRAVRGKEKAEAEFNALPAKHQENLNKQKRLIEAKIEDMSLDELREIGVTAKETQQVVIGYTEFDAKLRIADAELRKITAKIQSKCCGAAACNKKNLERQEKLQFEINVLQSLQAEIRNNPIKPERSKDQVQELKDSLAIERKKIEEIIDGYKDVRKALQKKVNEAAKKIGNVNKKIDMHQLEQCRSVDRDTMFNLIHLRARIAAFFRIIEKTYHQDAASKAVLDVVISMKESWRDKLNNALGAICYPTLKGQTGLQFYAITNEWGKSHSAEYAMFLSSEYSPNEFIDNVVPKSQSEVVDVLHTSGLGTVHDFFPAAKKKKSTDAKVEASEISMLKASSSSTHS